MGMIWNGLMICYDVGMKTMKLDDVVLILSDVKRAEIRRCVTLCWLMWQGHGRDRMLCDRLYWWVDGLSHVLELQLQCASNGSRSVAHAFSKRRGRFCLNM